MRRVLVLRPSPGAEATAAAAARLGLDATVAPLFRVEPVAWTPPDPRDHDALMLTSAHAPRCAGAGLARLADLPICAVGAATAQAAREAGLTVAIVGEGGADALVARMEAAGIRHALHLAGEDRHRLAPATLRIEHRIVYRAAAVDHLPDAAKQALDDGVVALLHSPRAAGLFAELLAHAAIDRAGVRAATISAATGAALGSGWARIATADRPTDAALLAAAAALCEEAGWDTQPVMQ